jgi:DNA-directed RNA polymerase specialized sigma24 family protein
VAEGDPEAFGVLYDQHAPWLLVRLRQRTADSDLADQVAQETFLVVWRDPAHRRLPSQLRGLALGGTRGRATRAEARRSGIA